MRDMWQNYEARTGKQSAELDGPPFPIGLEYVWEWFCELDAARTGSGFGANAVSFQELRAWASLNGLRPTGFELRCLAGLDAVRLASLAERA